MDRHITENTARAFDIGNGRRAWIAACDRHHFNFADSAIQDRLFDSTEIRVKAAVEAHHQHALFGINRGNCLFDAVHRQIDRFFAKHLFARAHELFDQIGMGVGGGTDGNRVYVIAGGDVIDAADRTAICLRNALGCFGEGIKDSNQRRAVNGCDCAGMHLADATGAQYCEFNRHVFSLQMASGQNIPSEKYRHHSAPPHGCR